MLIASLSKQGYNHVFEGDVLREAVMSWEERIVVDPQILVGKPVIKGTRLAVEFIVDLMAQGWSKEELLRNYPGITEDDLQACLQYASAMLHAERVYPQELIAV